MLSLKQQPHAVPTKWQYRLSRFMFTRSFWVITRVVLPVLLVAFVAYQIWSSQSVRAMADNVRSAVFQKVAYLPLFVVDELRFINATDLREEEIRVMIDFEPGTSFLEIDREEMLANLTGLDAVGSAQIRYGYTGKMDIVLEPRVPVLIKYTDGIYETIDTSGHRVEHLSERSERGELFVVSGLSSELAAVEAAQLAKYLAPFAERIRGLVRVGERRWDIVLVNDAKVMLPDEGALQALQTLLKQERTNDILNRDFEAYDLRNPDRPVLRLGAGVLEKIRGPLEGEG